MAKWKAKLAEKIFSSKKNDHPVEDSNKDYFHNIVPPNTTNFDYGPQGSNRYQNQPDKNERGQKIHEVKNVQVTSSFVIPLNKNEPATPFNPQGSNYQPHSSVFPLEHEPHKQENDTKALVSFKNNFKIPKALGFEIRIEKLKQLLMSLFAIVVIIVSSLFIAFYFSNSNVQFFPHPVITIPLVIFSLMLLVVNLNDFFSLKKEVNLYIERTLKGSLMPPNFIIRNYRKIHGRLIIFNWMFSFCYIVLGISAIIMYFISGQKLTFLVQAWTVQVPNLKTQSLTLAIILAVLFFLHMTSFVFFKKRKNNILSYYGYEIVSPQDLEIYKKKINRICMIITLSFLAIIFFMIAIPILVLRRKKKKG